LALKVWLKCTYLNNVKCIRVWLGIWLCWVIVFYIRHETYTLVKCLKFICIIFSVSLPCLFSWLSCVVFHFFCYDHQCGESRGWCRHWCISGRWRAFSLRLGIVDWDLCIVLTLVVQTLSTFLCLYSYNPFG